MYYQLKITLKDIKPPIWRRIVVSDQFTLAQLHNVIQTVFDWDNAHLAEFLVKGFQASLYPDEYSDGSLQLDPYEFKLCDLVLWEKDFFTYTYDFGDDWVHKIVVEKIIPTGPKQPTCLTGRRNRPPENCGGPWGYADLMARRDNDELDEDEESWLGDYDPTYFNKEEINQRLAGLDAD